MNPDRLLQHFETISEAEGAVPRLRLLILDLAIRGKLVSRDPNRATTASLLNHIEELKHAQERAGTVKPSELLPAIKPEEYPYELPKGWQWVRLGSLTSKIGSGSTPRGGRTVYTKIGVIFLRSQNVWNDGLRLDDVAYIPEKTHQKMKGTRVFGSDILLNITGASLGRCALVPDELGEANVSQHVTIIRPVLRETREYLHKCMLSPYVQEMVWGRQVGMAREGLSKKVLELFEIPLPPLDEQRQIVVRVDELMALCDELEVVRTKRETRRDHLISATLHRLNNGNVRPQAGNNNDYRETARFYLNHLQRLITRPEHIKQLRQTILNIAVRGKLVPQDRRDESADVMLRRITSTAKSRRLNRLEDKFEHPFEIPTSWTWVRLPRVLNKLTDGTHHSPPNGPIGEFKYVTAKNIKNEGVLLDGITYVSRKVHDEIYARCDPSCGDVLYIKDGATTGIATINQLTEPFSMLSSVALLKPTEAIFNKYLLWVMRSPFFYNETRGSMKGAAITRVTLSVMAESLLPLPPLAEQHRIVAKVDELMTLCNELEVQLTTTATTRRQLLEATLHEALSGSLEHNQPMRCAS